MYKRVIDLYHHWGCTSIYRPFYNLHSFVDVKRAQKIDRGQLFETLLQKFSSRELHF